MQTKFSLLRSAVTWLQGSRSSVHSPGHSPSATMKMACAEGRVPSYLRKHCMQSNTYLAWTFFFASTYAWFIVRNHLIWKNDQHEYKFMILWYALAHILQQFRHFSDYTATYISEGSIHWWRWLHSHQNVWMTAYQKVMTDLPSHSGLYKWV